MKIELGSAIIAIVESFLWNPREILHVLVHASYEAMTPKNEEIRFSAFLHFIFNRPGNNTRVLVCINDSPTLDNETEFVQMSQHDSCWRIDGVDRAISIFSKHFLAVFAEEWKEKAGESLPEKVRNNLPATCSLGWNGSGMDRIEVEFVENGRFPDDAPVIFQLWRGSAMKLFRIKEEDAKTCPLPTMAVGYNEWLKEKLNFEIDDIN